jgi:hypothetical protein
MAQKSYVTFGAQMGDRESDEIVSPHWQRLVGLLDKYCNKKYAANLNEFAPILRVDGDIWAWGFEGCKSLRLQRKHGYITLDIGMLKVNWQGKSPQEIKEFLVVHFEEGLFLIVKRLKKENMHIDEEALFEDFKQLKKAYLASE